MQQPLGLDGDHLLVVLIAKFDHPGHAIYQYMIVSNGKSK